MRDSGRHTEAGALQQRLDPNPRSADFRLGLAALRKRRFNGSRRLFEREVACLRGIVRQVVQLPLAVVVTTTREVQRDRVPTIAVVTPVAVEFLILLVMVRRRSVVGE